MPSPPGPLWQPSRRSVLIGGIGLVAGGLLAGCSDDGDPGRPGGTSSPAGGDATRSLVAFFDTNASIVAGSEQRLTFGVGDDKGALVEDAPAELPIEVRDGSGKVVGASQPIERHDEGLPRAYFPLLFTPPAPGTYEVTTQLDGEPATASFTAVTLNEVRVPGPGAALPDIHTPTTTDARGVDPICTRDPACPLHTIDVADARTTGKPIALLVATPAYCQVAICGPVLDVLLAAAEPFGDALTSIHVEVYKSAKQFEADPSNPTLAPALEGLNLTFEPSLFLIGADGQIVKRLDTIFDEVELRDELTTIVG